jgi:protein TonB
MGAMQASVQDRVVSALGTALILALLGYLLFVGMAVNIRTQADRAIALLDLRVPPPPPPHKRQPVRPKLSRSSSQASPPNLRNKAAPIVVPPPVIPLPRPSPVIVSPRAGTGMAPSNGASDRPGPGQGAGGQGNGLGSGGDGDGDGGDQAPRQIKGRLKYSDLPADLRDAGRHFTVAVRYEVETDGRVGDCAVAHSSGSAELDSITCQLIRQRFRFEPSHDADGRAVPSTIEENQSWDTDRADDDAGQ